MQYTRIAADQARMSGVPSCRNLVQMLDEGVKEEEIIHAFPGLTRQDIAEARRHLELEKLDRQSRNITIYLIAATVLTFFLGYYLLGTTDRITTDRMLFILSVALIGFSGSGMAALTSSLDRYANGFELEDGRKEPKEAKGGTFNRRMGRWFYVRPFVGFVVAPVLLWGMEFFVKDSPLFLGSIQHVAFSAFLGGLLAKSVLELIKNLFKNVFHV